jgi:hypothetical protein
VTTIGNDLEEDSGLRLATSPAMTIADVRPGKDDVSADPNSRAQDLDFAVEDERAGN